jgi:hypothetical protein
MVGIASVLMTIFHPGFFFEPMRKFKKSAVTSSEPSSIAESPQPFEQKS